MKVIRNTPDHLILEETPWILGIAMVGFILSFVGPGLFLVVSGDWMGLFFAGVGGGLGFMALAVFVQRIQLILDRRAGTLTLRHATILRYIQEVIPLTHLQGAELESRVGSKGRRLVRAELVLSSGTGTRRLPVTEVWTNGGGPGRTVASVNAWLATGSDRA